MFGELIGLWCAVVWQGMGQPSPLRLVELGPGRGTLMRDALRAAERVPGFLDALSVHLVETSEPMREKQRGLLPPPCVRPPHPQGGGGPPADRLARHGARGAGWRRPSSSPTSSWMRCRSGSSCSARTAGASVWSSSTPRGRCVSRSGTRRLMLEATPAAPAGAILELRAGEDELLAELGRRTGPCVALFIDYGPAEPAYRRHAAGRAPARLRRPARHARRRRSDRPRPVRGPRRQGTASRASPRTVPSPRPSSWALSASPSARRG